MAKAILVIDEMPASCGECQLYDPSYLDCEGADMSLYYQMPKDVKRQLANAEDVQYKPNWCPLKPVPTKYNTEKEKYRSKWLLMGYNMAIDEILGEENDQK